MHRQANGYSSKRDGTARRLSCLAGIVRQADGSYRCDCPRLCGAAHTGNVTVKVRADAAIAAVCEKCGNERLATWLELETRLESGMDDAERNKWLAFARTQDERLARAEKWLRLLADNHAAERKELRKLIELSETNVSLTPETP